MNAYADTSFLACIYIPHADSPKALRWLQRARDPLPFSPIHRHELRNAIRLRVFRGEISAQERIAAFREIDLDVSENVLTHSPIPWTDTFREAEALAAAHTEALGVRSFDLLHVGLAIVLGATRFLSFDARQVELARAAGLKVSF